MAQAITKKDYQNKVLESKKPVIVEIFSKTCGTCQQMKPIFMAVEEKHGNKYNFFTVDVEEALDLAKELGITSVPTFLFIKDGNIVATEQGYIPQEDFVEKIGMHFGK